MKRIAVTINPTEWDTLVTKYPANSKQVTVANFTSGTTNIDTDFKGDITKRKGGVVYSTLPTSAKDQYEMIFVDGTRHLLTVDNGNLRFTPGDGTETLVTAGYSPTANFEFVSSQDRAYFDNGVNTPQVYDKVSVYGGVTYTVPKTKDMGAQPPVSATTFGADTAGGAVPAGAHTYKITFLYYGFEESDGGPVSAVHTVSNPNNTVHLTALPIGGYGVTARKIYRDNNDGNWLLLDTVQDNTTTTYTDTLLIGATPTPIPADNGLPPTFGLIASWLEHIWTAQIPGNPYDLVYSAAGLPDIFPGAFSVTCNEQDPITAIVVYAGRLIVFNRKSMGQILGSTSNDFRYDPIISSTSIGCVDNRTIQIRVVEGVPLLIWLSDRGLYSYDGNSIQYISDAIEDLVNSSVQQTSRQNNSNTQASQAAFLAGTYTGGIDLLSDPGIIELKGPPERTWQDNNDWNGGSSLVNVVSHSPSELLYVPTKQILDIFAFTPVGGDWIPAGSYRFNNDGTGELDSGTIDTFSTSITNFTISLDIGLATGGQIIVEYSDDASIWNPLSIQNIPQTPSPTIYTYNFNLLNHRFFRIKIFDGIGNMMVKAPTIGFPITGTWISEAIDTTTDVTTYNSLTVLDTIPAGTSVAITVATSDDNIIYTSFGSFGAAIVKRYIKVKVVMTTTGDNVTTPTVQSITLIWSLASTFTSSAIDTVVTPAGWNIFIASFATNGGTIQFQMRSASTLIGLGVATFFNVTNGAFPPGTVLPLRFTQWRVLFTATGAATPEVSGVTISWFLTSSPIIRSASIFVNGRYYLAAATTESLTNNILIELDLKFKWRVHSNITVSTFSFFFNSPYYGSASNGQVIQWLQGLQDQGVNIPIDVRFKDLEFDTVGADNSTFLKALDYVVFKGRGTGASYFMSYSVDGGATFTNMLWENGTTVFNTSADGKPFYTRFKAQKFDTDLISGKSIMIRVTTNDIFDIAIESLKVYAWMWEFEPFLLS